MIKKNMTREELRHVYRDEICGKCYREFGCHWHGPAGNNCEEKFCEEAEDLFIEEYNIELND